MLFLDLGKVRRPELFVEGRTLATRRCGRSSLYDLVPVAGLGYEPENWRHGRFTDLDRADLYREETGLLVGERVQPVEGSSVFVSKGTGNPDDVSCVFPRGLCQ